MIPMPSSRAGDDRAARSDARRRAVRDDERRRSASQSARRPRRSPGGPVQVGRRGRDDPQHLGGGGLLLQRLASGSLRRFRCSSSSNSRAFSIAMTAWSANVSSSAICCVGERADVARARRAPIEAPPPQQRRRRSGPVRLKRREVGPDTPLTRRLHVRARGASAVREFRAPRRCVTCAGSPAGTRAASAADGAADAPAT